MITRPDEAPERAERPPTSPTQRRRSLATELVIRSPALFPALLMLPVFVLLALDDGGYPSSTWYPAAALFLGALAVALVALPAAARVPRTSAVAAVLLFAYAGWSYLSIAWARQKGIAWEGANRTALYAVVFALVALLPMRARPAAFVVGAFGLAIAAIGVGELIAAGASHDPIRWFIGGRFQEPTGYTNATVALWMVGFFPCVALGASRRVRPVLRALMLGGAVVLADMSLLGQSRGWQFAAPIAVAVFLAVARERTRTALALLGVVIAAAAAAPTVLDVYDVVTSGQPVGAALDDARNAIFIAAALLALAAYVVAHVDRRVRAAEHVARATGGMLTAAAVAGVTIGLALVVGKGDIGARISHSWDSFVHGTEPTSGARFGSALGSERYDFWRVSWRQFERAPVGGAGADNFQQDYLRERRSDQDPRYPHSIAMRTLGQTGIVGVLLFGGALAFAFAGALRAVRRRPAGLGSAAVLAGLGTFVYWLVHSLADWLFEFSGLAAPAFALLGIACALQPRAIPRGRPLGPRPLVRRAAVPVAIAAVVVAAVSMAAPWASGRYVQRASTEWTHRPATAFDDLDRAASFNPLSSEPHLVAATIALNLGRTQQAQREFRKALDRDSRDSYALLELGVLAADAGDRPGGTALVARAHALDPRDPVMTGVLRDLRRGRKVNLARVNSTYLAGARIPLRARR